jgi:trimethylamine corrinoid protein
MSLQDKIKDAIFEYDEDKLKDLCSSSINEKEIGPIEIVNIIGDVMTILGKKFEKEELMLPELMVAANIVKSVIDDILDPAIRKRGGVRESKGKVVIGTVKGDVHSIGKDLVASFLFSSGYEVFNLGVDVPATEFIDKAEEVGADVIGLSSLVTLSMDFQRRVIEKLKKRGLRHKYKVIVGGAPTSESWAKKIDADAWGDDSMDAVIKINQLIAKG